MDGDRLLRRLDNLEMRLAAMARELAEIRELASAGAAEEPDPEIEPFAELAPVPAPELVIEAEPPPEPAWPEPQSHEPKPGPLDELVRRTGSVDVADLLGTRGLAVAGGIVTLLGIVFFFVLAVNRGWIGPELRVLCGAAASAIVFGAGVWLERRGESTHAALAAVGAGIAGAYATLLAATALYDLLPGWAALIAAAAIAGIAGATALAWDSQLVAGLGLIGALLAPAAIELQDGTSQIATGFVALVLAGTVAVAVNRRWGRLLDVAALVSLPQIAVLVLQADDGDRAAVLVLAAIFWLLYLAAGVAWQEGAGSDALQRRSATFVSMTSIYSALVAAKLLGGTDQGIALLVVGAADAAFAVGAALRTRLRELAPILGAAALVVIAIGLATLLSGSSLTAVWAADAALLAFLASRLRDSRLELGAIAYLVLATLHALFIDARPDALLVRTNAPDFAGRVAHPAQGVPFVLAGAAAFAIAAWFSTRDLPEPDSPEGALSGLGTALTDFHRSRPWIAVGEAAAAGVLVLYAAALVIVDLFQRFGPGTALQAFEHAQVAIVGVWALTALGLIAAGLRDREAMHVCGLGWLLVTLVYLLGYCVPQLDRGPLGVAVLIVSGVLLATSVLEQLTAGDELDALAVIALGLSFALGVGGVWSLISATDSSLAVHGFALLGLGAVYGAVAAAIYAHGGERDYSTLLGLAALGLGAFAATELVYGTYLVLAWAAAGAALAVLAPVVGESRLSIAAAGFLVLALGQALREAPPSDLFTSGSHPAAGVPGLLFVIAGGVVLLLFLPDELERGRYGTTIALAVLAVYACSLVILAVAQHIGGGDTAAHFQRGQTAVSTFWGLIGLGLLYAGLRTGRRRLQLCGFALLGISLAKIFLYDLPSLSSVTRAISFLGVGALLLVSGYLYQRLSTTERG